MRNLTDLIASSPSRRALLVGLGATAAGASLMLPRRARADETPSGEPDEASVLRDPDSGIAGNPQGDIAIVEWFDRWCRERSPVIRQRILDYNEDDCRATRVLLDGIRALTVATSYSKS